MHDGAVLKQFHIPAQGESSPHTPRPGIVEGVHHEHGDGQVQKCEDQVNVSAFQPPYHSATSFSSPSKKDITAMLKRITTIITTEMAEPKPQSPTTRNCCSMRLPMRAYWPPANSLEMTNVVMAGMHTMVIPETTPGRLKGRMTLMKTWKGLAPRSPAASTTPLSILLSTE